MLTAIAATLLMEHFFFLNSFCANGKNSFHMPQQSASTGTLAVTGVAPN